MELSKNYIPAPIEEKWNRHWREKSYFKSKPDENKKPFTVVIPPPNVTGVLHMGHTLNETVQDILIRRARMSGYNACWVPGSDHASIATEARVVNMLKEEGTDKNQLGREKFLQRVYEWKEKYGGIIYSQIEKLGCSVDWDRVTFTMDDHYNKAVIKAFIALHDKNLIYREKRMINWDPKAKTALSDEEVIYREVLGKLYYIKYQIQDSNETITIATVRPETILGDTAICVHPDDERYMHLHGKYALVPIINRPVKIIPDEYVDKEFGTGALKITPAHDANDYQLGLKYKLEVIDIMNDDDTLNNFAGNYAGLERFEARKKIVEDLGKIGSLLKVDDYTHQIGFSERTNAVVEPALRIQWWVNMKSLAEPAINAVLNDKIKLHPSKFKNLYNHWMENIRDWCISRHLWWGLRIPAWYDENLKFVVAENKEEALKKYESENGHKPSNDLIQDEDVLDTWFSSWLWPIEVFKGMSEPDNADFNYYYPTSVLVTGQDIIFLWVARMIMAGYEFKNDRPFNHVYFTGMVRDKQGRKMSKSLGNSPDLLELIDKYGADAVRFGIMISSPAGNDLLFDEASLEQGRNFNNKLWNALKLVKMWKEKQVVVEGEQLEVGSVRVSENELQVTGYYPVIWFESRLIQFRWKIKNLCEDFKLSEAVKQLYSIIWDDFCGGYLEFVKPVYGGQISQGVYKKTIAFFSELLQLLHPFMPFITEEIYHLLEDKSDDLCVTQFSVDYSHRYSGSNFLPNLISLILEFKAKNKLNSKSKIKIFIVPSKDSQTKHFDSNNNLDFKNSSLIRTLKRAVSAEDISFDGENIPENCPVVTFGEDKFYIESESQIDVVAIKENLLMDLEYQKWFLQSVEKKLNNDRFVQNAKPEIIALEQKKKADAEAKIKVLEESLANL